MFTKVFNTKIAPRHLGKAAEDLAIHYFVEQGFVTKARNYRYQRAEVDIITQKNQLLIFVEVKARSSDQFGYPESFVSAKQQRLLHAAAEHYMMMHGWCHAVRFDIIAIRQIYSDQFQLTHFEDAF